jgi:hypothetical protein
LSDDFLGGRPDLFDPQAVAHSDYNLPFAFRPRIRRLLIVGAGAGNNAAADAILNRDMSVGLDSGSTSVRTPRQAIRFLRNKFTVSAGTLTVFKEDDSTTSWTGSVTSSSAAFPVTGNDPAGP